jgi:soluble lytic murein transglycosylase-like protein
MTPEELNKWLTLGTMGAQVASGVAGAGTSSASRAYQQQQDLYNRQQAAREAGMAWLNSLLSGQTARATALADRMPLGAEQGYVQRQALLGAMGRNIAGMPLPTGYGGTVNPLAGLDVNRYFGDAQTAAALAERRKALAGIEPNFQFGALSGYGLGDAATTDQAVADYAKAIGEQRLARENAMTQFLVDQSRAVGLGAPSTTQPGQPAPSKKKSVWSTIGKVAAAAAPFVAGGMKNISPQTMKTIQAASGAAQGALSGGGAGGAALGAVSGYMAPAVQPTGIGIREAILNPRALGTIASAGLPGVYGTIGQMVSSGLRGYTPKTQAGVPGTTAFSGIPEGYGGAPGVGPTGGTDEVVASILSQQPAVLDTTAPTKEEVAIINAAPRLPVPSPYTPSQSVGDLIRSQQEQEELNFALRYPQGTSFLRGIIESNTARIQQIDQDLAQLEQPAAKELTIDRIQREARIAALQKEKAAAQTRLREASQSSIGRLLTPATPSSSSRVNPEAFAPTPRPSAAAISLQDRVIAAESGGNPNAISPKGAVGLMQVMPQTAVRPGFGLPTIFDVARRIGVAVPLVGPEATRAAVLLKNPDVNRAFGQAYLDAMLTRYGGDQQKALIAYNAGPAVADKFTGKIDTLPAETQAYISKILTQG